jgi:VanZ family protein
MRADMKSRFRAGAKVCSGAIMVLLVIAPAKWAPRTELGWQFDHFIGYFGITLFFCFAWPRPFMVGGVVMAAAALLEALQALTPDRSANLEAALWGAAGALTAALVCHDSSRQVRCSWARVCARAREKSLRNLPLGSGVAVVVADPALQLALWVTGGREGTNCHVCFDRRHLHASASGHERSLLVSDHSGRERIRRFVATGGKPADQVDCSSVFLDALKVSL